MPGGRRRHTRQNPQEENDNSPSESEDTTNVSILAEQEAMEAIQTKIIAEIQAVHVDVKKDLNEAIGTLKNELADFRGEMSTKLNDISSELKEITDRVEATEQRVAEVEESHAEHAEMITYTLELQKSIQAQLTDLEARSRRNNIRIRGIAEGSEGDNMKTFLEQFLKDELVSHRDSPRYSTLPPITGPRPRKIPTPGPPCFLFSGVPKKSSAPLRLEKKGDPLQGKTSVFRTRLPYRNT
ncbi:hypothetical protein D5F01_LYC13970 [Larimichthys crocea]|uniref:LINE-1 type transposase domain-containing protein 1 n=1 Tax=Larimichthys crocea TaxID=215358 RepID=A0A6G0I9K9_LARCR|nr:hypothetical protein D5F01_LYC13970 [Larimichthys crocea]